jgi:hypothetical protein
MEKLKNIRFNLRFFTGSDSFESVHSVDELGEKLRNNQIAFDDLMAYFFSGQLQRWLECHGAKDSVLLEKLRAIDSKATNKEIVKALFAALGFCFDEREIDRMIVSYDFPSRLQETALKNTQAAEAQLNSVQNEIEAYEATCRQILQGRKDSLLVKKLIGKIVDKYLPLLELDVVRFFAKMKSPENGCPVAILELLARKTSRRLFLRENVMPDKGAYFSDSLYGHYDKACVNPKELNYWMKFTRTRTNFWVEISGSNVRNPQPIDLINDYSDATSSWKQLVPKGRKVMILCNSGVEVLDGKGEKWEESGMNNRFLVLDGCSYKQVFSTKAFLAYWEL